MSRWDVPDALWSSNNLYDVPTLRLQQQADALDAPVVTWGSVSRSLQMDGTWHFYTDDYRFTALLNDPSPVVETGCVTAVEPNFSIHQQTPVAVGLFRIYQKRWIARYWQSKGIRIFVDLNVAPKFLDLNLLGVPEGWRAYATRGYNAKVGHTIEEHEAACQRAGTESVLFVVYGGGEDVQQLCADRGFIWIPEHYDRVKLNGQGIR